MIATDRSGSMLAKDVAPSRLVAARRAAGTFLDAVPDDVRVGAVAFNHKPTVLQTPTRDHAAVREALASVQGGGQHGDRRRAGGGAAHDRGVAHAAGEEAAAGGDRPALRRQERPRARRARGGRGGAQGEGPRLHRRARHGDGHDRVQARRRQRRVSTPVPPDPATLKQVAERTGGKAFAIDDAAQLDAGLRAARLAARDREAEEGDDEPVRRRGAAADVRRRRGLDPLVRPARVTLSHQFHRRP